MTHGEIISKAIHEPKQTHKEKRIKKQKKALYKEMRNLFKKKEKKD